MTTRYRNASGREMKVGEAVSIVGDSIYPATASEARSLSGLLLVFVKPDGIVRDADILVHCEARLKPDDTPDHFVYLRRPEQDDEGA